MVRRSRVYKSFPEWLMAKQTCMRWSEDFCTICMEEGELVALSCSHSFCLGCLSQQLAARWAGPRVTFGFLHCALCRSPLSHILLEPLLLELWELRRHVIDVAHQRFCEDDMDSKLSARLGRKATEEETRAQAEQDMVVYICADCDTPYCAGRVECAAGVEGPAIADLRCQDCEWERQNFRKGFGHRCMLHGPESAIFKCDYCCELAVWDCGEGLGHFCERCHRDAGSNTYFPCPGPEVCPLGIPHPPNQIGNLSFVCGCTSCVEVELGVPQVARRARSKNPWKGWRLDERQVWGEEDWLAWEDERFWEVMDGDRDDDDHDYISAKQRRSDDVRKQAKKCVQKVWIPRMDHSLVVGERVKAHFRAQRGQRSRRIELAIVVSLLSGASVQLIFPNSRVQTIPNSWVTTPKSMPLTISKTLCHERWKNAVRRRPQRQIRQQRRVASSVEMTCDVLS